MVTPRIDPVRSLRGKMGNSRKFKDQLARLTGRRRSRLWYLFSGDTLIATCETFADAAKWSAGVYTIQRRPQ